MLRHSAKRDEILRNLQGRYDHPTADMLYEDLRQTIPNISLGTVYRNLSLLCESGDIIRVGITQNEKERYDGHTEPHAHFICDTCGKVLDIWTTIDTERIENEISVKITSASHTFRGICRECLDK